MALGCLWVLDADGKVFVFAHPPISPICRTPLFPYLTVYSCFFSSPRLGGTPPRRRRGMPSGAPPHGMPWGATRGVRRCRKRRKRRQQRRREGGLERNRRTSRQVQERTLRERIWRGLKSACSREASRSSYRMSIYTAHCRVAPSRGDCRLFVRSTNIGKRPYMIIGCHLHLWLI